MGSKERMSGNKKSPLKSDGAEYDLECFFWSQGYVFNLFQRCLLINFGVSPQFSTPEEVARDTSGTKRGSGNQLGD